MVENVKELLKAHEGIEREVYLDTENSSTVPKEIVEAMLPYYDKLAYGNPTLTHKPGWEAYETIMESSQKIASYINCSNPEQINFTPSETEANNLAILGSTLKMRGKNKKIVISEIEPINVLNVAEMAQAYGFRLSKIPVNSEGFLNLEKLKAEMDRDTVLVSIASVNNEIGTVQPIHEALEIVKDASQETLFHTDATDAFGKIPFDTKKLNVDLATLSSYKIQGPRGAGALFVKEHVDIEKILEGQLGTQKLWPGIENTPAIVGFAKASELAFRGFDKNAAHMSALRDKLVSGIAVKVPDVLLNGPSNNEKRAPDNANISVLRCEGEALTIELSLKGVYVSSGSACSRRLLQPSHVLAAIGRRFDEAHGSMLMKTTRYHTEQDINYVLEAFPKAVERIRSIVGSTGVR